MKKFFLGKLFLSLLVSICAIMFIALSVYAYGGEEDYDPFDSVLYAHCYYNLYNCYYPDLTQNGGDCANFVSQCLEYGGVHQQYDWYCEKKNDVYRQPTDNNELNFSWNISDPSPWISAEDFDNFWSSRVGTDAWISGDILADPLICYYSPYYEGDVIVMENPVFWWWVGAHCMIITDYGSYNGELDFQYSAHSNERYDYNLLQAVNANSNKRWKFFSFN